MIDKILYGLGCTCDQHMICQQNFRQYTAPSLFAGCVQLQNEKDTFIPQYLFDNTFEDNFFGMQNWRRIKRITYNSSQPKYDGIYITEDGQLFQYFNNRQHRLFIQDTENYQNGKIDENRIVLINEKLGIINFHSTEKTSGTNPIYEDYQRAKYKFFKQNKYNFKYLIYLHKDTTEEHLTKFHEFLILNGYDIDNFTIYNRTPREYQTKFKYIKIPDYNEPQSNIAYLYQSEIIKQSIRQIMTNV